MSDLIGRLEKATGPDRELDAAICLVIGRPQGIVRAPAYTASIDAALTLAPEGWRVYELCEWDGVEPCGWHCKLSVKNLVTPFEVSAGWPDSNDDHKTKQLRTAALAICAAALKARAATRGQGVEPDWMMEETQ